VKAIIPVLFAALLLAGCVTPKIDWAARAGNYTYDQAVMEFGPPDKSAKLSDGTTIAEWLAHRGYAYATSDYYPFYTPGFVVPPATYNVNRVPDDFLRLTFGADGKLKAWKKFYR
jgi:hypothetical protein